MFSLRIFTINYYLAKPEQDLDYVYSDFRCLEVKQVPIIRIFGTTPEGIFLSQIMIKIWFEIILKDIKLERSKSLFTCT